MAVKKNRIPIKQLYVVASGWYEQIKKVKVSLDGNFISYPLTKKSFKETVESCKKKGFELQIVTYFLSEDNRPKNQMYYLVELYTQLKGIDTPTPPAPTQNAALDHFHLLLADSTAKIQEKAAWDLERMKLNQDVANWKDKYDLIKEKNTELIANCAKLEGITEKMEKSAKDMESKASFTDALKGLAGTVMPMLMGGGGGNAQLAGLNQGQQIEQQEPTYLQTLEHSFGDLAPKVDAIVVLLAENPKIIGRTRDWLETNKPKANAE